MESFAEQLGAILEDKVLIPGVIDTTTNFIEHPRVVASRIRGFTDLVGAARVIAGTDCGFSTFAGFGAVDPEIVYAKLATLAKGAGARFPAPVEHPSRLSHRRARVRRPRGRDHWVRNGQTVDTVLGQGQDPARSHRVIQNSGTTAGGQRRPTGSASPYGSELGKYQVTTSQRSGQCPHRRQKSPRSDQTTHVDL